MTESNYQSYASKVMRETHPNNSLATKKELQQETTALRKDTATLRKGVTVLEVHLKASILATEQRLSDQAKQYRDQILNTFDKYLKEVLDSRQERVFISARLTDHEERLEKLEGVFVDKATVTDSK